MLADTTVDFTSAGDFPNVTIVALLWSPFGLNPMSLAFGDVPVGNNARLPVTVRNNWTSDTLIITAVRSPLGFTVTPNPRGQFPLYLSPQECRQLDVTFSPFAMTLYRGDVVFIHNGPGDSTQLAVTGRGVCAAPTRRARIIVRDASGSTETLWFGFPPTQLW